MPSSRQDLLHSYQYSLQRVVAALVTHDPDPARSPLRRAGSTVLVSLLVAAIAVGATAAYGLLTNRRPANPTDERVVFTEKESGARYIYYKPDGKLHPVLNYTSGLLITRSGEAKKVDVARKALARVPLGAPMGIPGAPDALPAPAELLKGAWTICSVSPVAGDPAARPQSLLVVGGDIEDGTVAASPRPGAPPEALLVVDPANRVFLVYANRRFLVPESKVQSTKIAFGWNQQQPLPVAAAWINAVPAGPDVSPPAIGGLGEGSVVANAKVGNLFQLPQPSGRAQWAVALADGVADISEIQAQLLLADPDTSGAAGAPKTLDLGAFQQLPRSPNQVAARRNEELPETAPPLMAVTQRVCLVVPPDAPEKVEVRADPTVPAGVEVTAPPTDGQRVDRVSVPRTRGALVESAASPSAPSGTGTVSVVLDTGSRYPLANDDVRAMLGYGATKPLAFPAELVDLLPEGPSLDPEKAAVTHPDID